MVYFGGPDVVGHRFWRFLRPDLYRHPPGPGQLANFGRIVPDYYAYMDSAIGELVEAFGPGTTVLIISDHGMQPINTEGTFTSGASLRELNSGHHMQGPPGVLIAAGPHVRAYPPRRALRELTREDLPMLGSVYDITPTLLALLRIPLGKDMDGRVVATLASDDFNIAVQPEMVATHDTPEFLTSRPPRDQRNALEEERLRQLRSLGYVK
jgi:arylsulfatase A-like enzyme